MGELRAVLLVVVYFSVDDRMNGAFRIMERLVTGGVEINY